MSYEFNLLYYAELARHYRVDIEWLKAQPEIDTDILWRWMNLKQELAKAKR